MKKPTPQLSLISLCILNIYSLSAYAENNTITLDEITVVGEKFERNQSTTGSSTSVVTTDQLKREANLLSATQLLKRDVNISDTGLGNDLPTVRGVDGSGPAGSPVVPAYAAPSGRRGLYPPRQYAPAAEAALPAGKARPARLSLPPDAAARPASGR